MDDPNPNSKSARISLVRRSNRNYDELIREYIRAARERLEAAKRTTPPPATSPHDPSPIPSEQRPPLADASAAQYQSPHSPNAPIEDGAHNPFRDAAHHNGLVREASIGRSHKPTLTRILPRRSHEQGVSIYRSADGERRSSPDKAHVAKTPTPSPGRHRSAYNTSSVHVVNAAQVIGPRSSISGDTIEFEYHTESSPPTHPLALRSAFTPRPDTAASSASTAPSFRFGDLPSSARHSPLSERVGSRRPAPLDVDAIKQAEARGSLTSLPDLIRRALRLASNLEKGRTSSKFGTDWLVGGSPEKDTSRQHANNWPFPAENSPTETPGNRKRTTMSAWARSSGLQTQLHRSHLPYADRANAHAEKPRQELRGRYCGMPRWGFVLILVIIFLLIVAAILVPIFLIVIPQRHQNLHKCANGGTVIESFDGSLQCICVNGYTGSSCERIDDTGCVLINTLVAANASVGIGFPAVLEQATSNYGINLNTSSVLGLLSTYDLPCASETSLITFNGLSSRSIRQNRPEEHNTLPLAAELTASSDAVTTTTPGYRDARRRNSTSGIATSDGIIFATSSPPSTFMTASSTTPSIPSATPTASVGFNPNSEHTLGFARTVVLFILQSSEQLSQAYIAHAKLDAFFAYPSLTDAENLDLGSGWTANLIGGTISEPQGDVFGG